MPRPCGDPVTTSATWARDAPASASAVVWHVPPPWTHARTIASFSRSIRPSQTALPLPRAVNQFVLLQQLSIVGRPSHQPPSAACPSFAAGTFRHADEQAEVPASSRLRGEVLRPVWWLETSRQRAVKFISFDTIVQAKRAWTSQSRGKDTREQHCHRRDLCGACDTERWDQVPGAAQSLDPESVEKTVCVSTLA